MSNNIPGVTIHTVIQDQPVDLGVLDGTYVFENKCGSTVIVKITDPLPGSEPSEYRLGGVINELVVPEDYTVVLECVGGECEITQRAEGVLDPDEDVTVITQSVANAHERITQHLDDVDNPHSTTKEQVGLGNLPNATTGDPSVSDPEILASSEATGSLYTQLGAHETDLNNPHGTTKDQVGLGNVPNFAPATDDDARDPNVVDKIMTPHATHAAIAHAVEVSVSITPQLVVRGAQGIRPSGWSSLDCDVPPTTVIKKSDTLVTIQSGLQMTFACNHKSRLSAVLENALDVSIPITVDGNVYLYADISSDGEITNFGTTRNRPGTGSYRGDYAHDFFNRSLCEMTNSSNELINRVYIANIVVLGNAISQVYATPIGDEYIMPITTMLQAGDRYICQNPFIGDVSVTPEIFYQDAWGPTGWNDQIGIRSHMNPYNKNAIVTQIGRMGFMCDGEEGGSPFGHSFVTITEMTKLRLRIRKI